MTTIIQELIELDNPKSRRELGLQLLTQGASVSEVRKRTGASENTVKSWRRRARNASGDLSSEAATPVHVLAPEAPTHQACPEDCGFMIPMAWSDESILTHWAKNCPSATWQMKSDARKSLRERECSDIKTRLNLPLLVSAPTVQETGTADTGIGMTAETPMMDSRSDSPNSDDDTPENDSLDSYYGAKFDGNGNVWPDWSYDEWLKVRWCDGTKTSTKNAVTVTHPRRSR